MIVYRQTNIMLRLVTQAPAVRTANTSDAAILGRAKSMGPGNRSEVWIYMYSHVLLQQLLGFDFTVSVASTAREQLRLSRCYFVAVVNEQNIVQVVRQRNKDMMNFFEYQLR